jgi:hypothetical protein
MGGSFLVGTHCHTNRQSILCRMEIPVLFLLRAGRPQVIMNSAPCDGYKLVG